MQAVVLKGLRSATDLILQPKDDNGSVCEGQSPPASIRSHIPMMHNYLLLQY
jgi:hypothetical protein